MEAGRKQQLTAGAPTRAAALRDIHGHKRVNDILLGPLERPALRWLSAHMPAWMTPDLLTAIGVLGAVLIMVSYALSALDRGFLWLASVGYLVNWFGDSLDGTLARYRNIERPKYGFFLDHTVDAVTQAIIILGIGLTPYVNFTVTALLLITYLMLSVIAYVRTCVTGEFRISYGRLGPTEVRVIALMLNAAMFFLGAVTYSVTIFGGRVIMFTPYDIGVATIGFLLFSFFLHTAWKEGRQLAASGE
jgi:phosphatidylglycerophosphate synthase